MLLQTVAAINHKPLRKIPEQERKIKAKFAEKG
jgi:hypothetical protein